MALKEADNTMITKKLMKMIGFHQMLDPQTKKLFGINIVKFAFISEMIFFFAIFCLILATICFLLINSNDLNYLQLFTHYLLSAILIINKLYSIIKYSDLIWTCIKLTNINNFLYPFHDLKILNIGKKHSKYFAISIVLMWIGLVILWISAPLLLKNLVINIKHGDKIYHYRHNILNLVFPASDKFYNQNFSFYYIFEALIVLLSFHIIIFYDFLTISLCVVKIFQIKTIRHSYSNFDKSHKHVMDNEEITLKEKEAILIFDLKILIHDHQHVMRNTKRILQFFRPVMFLQVFGSPTIAILSWSITVMDYFNGDSIVNTLNYKILLSPIIYFCYFYINCYLLHQLQEEKDKMHFAMYCSGWHHRNIEFSKLIKTSMAIDRCNHMNIRLTEKKLVNLVMFSSVVQMTYSIFSVLVKIIIKINK